MNIEFQLIFNKIYWTGHFTINLYRIELHLHTSVLSIKCIIQGFSGNNYYDEGEVSLGNLKGLG